MIINTAKADNLMRELKDRLEKRLAGAAAGRLDTVREAKDADGYPMLFLSDAGNEAAGQPVIALRIKQIDAVSKDVFNNSMKAYNPHVMEMAYELDATEAEPARKDILKVSQDVFRIGIKVQLKEIADGTAVTEANINAAAVAEEYDDLYWPSKGA